MSDISFDIIARDKATSTFNKVARSSDGASGHILKFGKIAGVALGGAGLAAAGLGVKLAKMAVTDEASTKKLAKALQNNAKATKGQVAQTEKWITAQGKAYGVTDDDLRPALVRLVAATHNVGKAQKLASLAMNISAGTGKDLGAVSLALGKAQAGNVGALGRLGIATKGADGKTLSLAKITDKLAQTFKGQAATAADTAAGRFARVKVAFSETAEAIGYHLLPVASKLADWLLNRGIPAFKRFATKVSGVADTIRGAFDKIDLSGFAEKVKTVLDKVDISNLGAKLADQAKSWAGPVIGGFKTGLDTGDWSGLGKALGNGIIRALKGAGKVAGKLTSSLTAMFKKVDWVGLGIKVGTIALPLVLGLATGIINGVGDPGLWKGIWAHLPEILWAALAIALAPSKVIGPIAKILERIPFVGRFLAAALKWVNKLGGPMRRFAGDLFKTFGRAFTEGANLPAGRIVGRVMGALKFLPMKLYRFYIDLGTRIGVWAFDAFKWMGSGAGKAVGGLLRLVGRVPLRIIKSLGKLDRLLFNAGKDIMKGLLDGIVHGFKAVGSKLKDITSKIPKLKGPPERDARLLRPNGRLIMGGLVAGISDGIPKLERQLGGLTNQIAVQGPAVALRDTHATTSARGSAHHGTQFTFTGDMYAQDFDAFLRQAQTRARHSSLDGRRR